MDYDSLAVTIPIGEARMSKKPPAPEATPPGPKLVRLELSDEDHSALRVLAAKAGMSMAAYARWLIHDHVAKHGGAD